MVGRLPDADFWEGRRVLLTGHTGFKGAWLALWLKRLGAVVSAVALPPPAGPSLAKAAAVDEACSGIMLDIRDAAALARAVRGSRPSVVFHLAAQALVRQSLADPLQTFETNVNGTLNLLEGLRNTEGIDAAVFITSDKVYLNDGRGQPYREDDALGGKDPYSASKAACEIAVKSYAECFFPAGRPAIATARAGNVIGGGDFAIDRIVPDCVRAAAGNRPILLRHPRAVRPWQHVLDCLCGYLLFAETLVSAPAGLPRALNFGPGGKHAVTVEALATAMRDALGSSSRITHAAQSDDRESSLLLLNSDLARRSLGWQDRLPADLAIAWTAAWYRQWSKGKDMRAPTLAQIEAYGALREHAE
ncbi:CDP-glucose 4,6-dehydratase [Aestuariivirga sp.]|uniref:CDP-glucose 4,6-dehydratase n=1 Tax=Aestuariivirga sp. TaxID=2650926 RepID=UPI0025C2272B|nr:CDP-glucose 4,6-dehydratase [Aestuariivirga sp.]MCA3556003.1 CDP-glucose 4,6-dehydratase [Aestuariivirga sp.]